MRFCHSCRRLTLGNPQFCNGCGASFNTKFCPARHPNPIGASACSVCGSRDLSVPQKQSSLLRRGRLVAAMAAPTLLALTILYAIYYAHVLLTKPMEMLWPIAGAAALGALWLLLVTATEVLGLWRR